MPSSRARRAVALFSTSEFSMRLAEGEGQHLGLGGARGVQLGHDAPVAHDEHAVAHAQQLGQLGRDHQDALALRGEPVHELVDLDLRGHVDAARGLVHDEDVHLRGQPLRRARSSAGCRRRGGARAGRGSGVLMRRSATQRPARTASVARAHDAPRRQAARVGQGHVALDGEAQHEPLGLAVLGDEAEPVGRARPKDARIATARPFSVTFPECARSAPMSVRASSVRPAPSSPVTPDDLAAAQREAHVAHQRSRA